MIIEILTGIVYPEIDTNRNAVIARIKKALETRSGKKWSVTGSTGTSWGWITIDAPPKRRTWRRREVKSDTPGIPPTYEWFDAKGEYAYSYSSPSDRAELAQLLGLPNVHDQGQSVPASNEHYREFVDRAEGRAPRDIAKAYWD